MGAAWNHLGRVAVPQLLTASRVAFGAAGILAATEGQLYRSATMITLGTVTDGIDGFMSRRLGVSSSFGAVFDYFADYTCFVIAPWMLVARAHWPKQRAYL